MEVIDPTLMISPPPYWRIIGCTALLRKKALRAFAEDPVKLLLRYCVNQLPPAGAGAVQKNVDAAQRRLRIGRQLLALSRIPERGGEKNSISSHLLDSLPGFLKFAGFGAANANAGSRASQRNRHGPAPAGTGNKSCLVFVGKQSLQQ